MDEMPTFSSLFEQLAARVESGGKKFPEKRSLKKVEGHPSKRGSGPEGFLPLVSEDQLFFRTVPHSSTSTSGLLDSAGTAEAVIAEAFRTAFGRVWRGIPPQDRQRLLDHWRRGPHPTMVDRPLSWYRWPLIQLSSAGSLSSTGASRLCGHAFDFAVSQGEESTDHLRLVIAKTVGEVFRKVTGEHWRLVMSLIEQPYTLWERKQRANVSDARCQMMWDRHCEKFLLRHEAEVHQLMCRWGVVSNAPEPRRDDFPDQDG